MAKVCLILLPNLVFHEPMLVCPLGILHVAASLEENGHEVVFVDLRDKNLSNNSPSAFPEADFYGLGPSTTEWPDAAHVVTMLREEYPKAGFMVGGTHVNWVPGDGLKLFDAVVVGDGELAVLDVVERGARGIVSKPVKDLDSLPFPARHLLPPEAVFNDQIIEGTALRPYAKKGGKSTGIIASRGCPFRCAFCLPRGTLVLTADLRWVPIQDVKKGVKVIGVKQEGRWKYTIGEVTQVFEREADVWEIGTDEGTVRCTVDHPWLMHNGFKSIQDVLASQKYNGKVDSSRHCLRKLSPATKTPELTTEYMWGYISGALAGDGCMTMKHHVRPYGEYDYRRLSLVGDGEMLDRTLQYAHALGLPLHERKFNGGMYKRINRAVVCDRHRVNERIWQMVIKQNATDEYKRGFLAGIFDAEGSASKGILRLSNRDRGLKTRVLSYLTAFGFQAQNEEKDVRLLGGLSEMVRFFVWTNPAVIRKTKFILGKEVYKSVQIRDIKPIGSMKVYNLQTTSGTFIADGFVTHNCSNPEFLRVARFRSVQNVVAEVKELIDRYGCYFYRFNDDTFTLNRRFTMRLCEELRQLNVGWRCHTRCSLVDAELLNAMRDAGCLEIAYGVETADDGILRLLRKGESVDAAKHAIRLTKEMGIQAKTYWMVGLPKETWGTIEKIKAFMRELQPDKWSLSTMMPFPGCDIYRDPEKYGVTILDHDWKKYWLYDTDKEDYSPIETDVASKEELVEHRKELWRFLVGNEWSK